MYRGPLAACCAGCLSCCLRLPLKARRRWEGSWSSVAVTTAAAAALAFWLLLWLVRSEGGVKCAKYRRLAAVRRRLAAAAEGPAALPTVLRQSWGKLHVH